LPRLRRLSGNEVVGILEEFGFEVISQRGSHVKLRRVTASGMRETLVMPSHHQLDTGTLRAIIRQAGHYIGAPEFLSRFYTD